MKLDIGIKDETRQCARCGGSFSCGAASGHCWCFDLPKVIAVPGDSAPGCLCPDCLKAAIKSQTSLSETK